MSYQKKIFPVTYEAAERFLSRHREFNQPSPIPLDSIVEYIDVLSSDEMENEMEAENEPVDLGGRTIDEWFHMKSERNTALQNTISKLNKRIGMEIIDSDEDSNDCHMVPRYKIPEDTRNLQRDFEFVPKLLYRSKV